MSVNNIIAKRMKGISLDDINIDDTISAYELLRDFLIKEIKCSERDVEYIVSHNIDLLDTPLQVLKDGIKAMLAFGFPKHKIKNMVKNLPKILTYTLEDFNRALKVFKGFSYDKDEFIRMASCFSPIIDYSDDFVQKTFDDYGVAVIYLDNECIPLGLSFQEIREIFLRDSSMFEVPSSRLEEQVSVLYSCELPIEDIRTIITTYPSFLTHSFASNIEKIEFYKTLDLLEEIINNAMRLRQSTILTEARIYYLQSHDVPIVTKTDKAKLFASSNYYETTFGINNAGIIAIYNIHRELEAKHYELKQVEDEEW